MTPWTVARQAPLAMESSRQEYWSRLPLPTPGDLPVGTEPVSLASPALAGRFFTTASPGKPSADSECIYKQLTPWATGTLSLWASLGDGVHMELRMVSLKE